MIVLLSVLSVYVLGCVAIYSVQDKLVFPGASLQHTNEAASYLHPGTDRVAFKAADGTNIVARFTPATDGPSTRPTIVLFYGNGMCAAWTQDMAATFRTLGCNTLVPDYIGFGESDGKPGEANCYATADACMTYLEQRGDIDMTQILPTGLSLGSGVAIDLASRRPVAGVITMAGYTSLARVAQEEFWFLPVKLLLRARFDSMSKVDAVECPVLLFHGSRDTLIRPHHAQQLAAKLGNRGTLVMLERADHNTIFTAEPEVFRDSVAAFLKRLPKNIEKSD